MPEREFMLRVRLTEEEREMLWTLAEDKGLTASDFIRQIIRNAWAERDGAKRR